MQSSSKKEKEEEEEERKTRRLLDAALMDVEAQLLIPNEIIFYGYHRDELL